MENHDQALKRDRVVRAAASCPIISSEMTDRPFRTKGLPTQRY